jgi:hypothetical protein
MKSILALSLLLSGAVQASDFTFTQNTDGTWTCPSYCTGYTTSDPSHSIDYVNVLSGTAGTYSFTISLDGTAYHALNATSPFTVSGVTFAVNFTTTRTCTHSGRGQTCVTRYHAVDGSVSAP